MYIFLCKYINVCMRMYTYHTCVPYAIDSMDPNARSFQALGDAAPAQEPGPELLLTGLSPTQNSSLLARIIMYTCVYRYTYTYMHMHVYI